MMEKGRSNPPQHQLVPAGISGQGNETQNDAMCILKAESKKKIMRNNGCFSLQQPLARVMQQIEPDKDDLHNKK